MKKAILILLCGAMLVATTSCSKSDDIDSVIVHDNQNVKKITDNFNIEKYKGSSAENTDIETAEVYIHSLEKYIGIWYDDFMPPNDLEIIFNNDGKIECHLGIYRLTTFHLIVDIENKKNSFVDKYDLVSGEIEFKDNSILVTIEESNTEYIQRGANYLFTIKDDQMWNNVQTY